MTHPTIITLGSYYIAGRGKVFTADRRKHDFELLNLMGCAVLIGDEEYTVQGIETTMGITPGNLVGLLVTKN